MTTLEFVTVSWPSFCHSGRHEHSLRIRFGGPATRHSGEAGRSRSERCCWLFVVFALLATAAHAQWLNYREPGTARLPNGKANLTASRITTMLTERTPD